MLQTSKRSAASLDGEKLFITQRVEACAGACANFTSKQPGLGAGSAITFTACFFPDPASIYRCSVPTSGGRPVSFRRHRRSFRPPVATPACRLVTAWRRCVHPFSQPPELPALGHDLLPFRALRAPVPPPRGWFIEEVQGLPAVLGKAVIGGASSPQNHAASLKSAITAAVRIAGYRNATTDTTGFWRRRFNPTWCEPLHRAKLLFDDPARRRPWAWCKRRWLFALVGLLVLGGAGARGSGSWASHRPPAAGRPCPSRCVPSEAVSALAA